MMPGSHSNPTTDHEGQAFATTHWTRILEARGDSEESKAALSDLCAVYYEPVFAFIRRNTSDEESARDLTQEFFAGLLARQGVDTVDPRRGRFRSFLLGAVKHFLSNRRRHAAREKRGGHVVHQPLPSETDTSAGPVIPASSTPSPEALFDREWALSVLERAFDLLKRECEQAGTLHEFETLKPWLTGESGSSQADAARALGLSSGALRVAIHRFRRRFRTLVKAQIAKTVQSPVDIAQEMQHLIQALS